MTVKRAAAAPAPVLGGTAGLSHADANAVMLPHVMRFNADVAAGGLARAGSATGADVDGLPAPQAAEAAARYLERWMARMPLPRRLRDSGVRRDDLPGLAAVARGSPTVQKNPKPPRDAGQLLALGEGAW